MKKVLISIALLSLAVAGNVSVPPTAFLAIVGEWSVAKDAAGKTVLQVDGRQWIKGQPSAGLAAKARTIYGAKHEEFIDSVKASENVHIPLGEWHTIKIAVSGTQLRGFLDDKAILDYTLAESVSGKVGVWSKTDSVSQFDQFVVK